MKFLIPLFAIPLITQAATFEIIGPCSSTPLFSQETNKQFETVGDLTIHLLNKNHIPYIGNERGMNSIFNTIIGLDALEVLNDSQMRSYGWCYSVNDKVLESYADEVYLNDGDHIKWFFSYAWYDKGWISMCNPAYEVKSPIFCK